VRRGDGKRVGEFIHAYCRTTKATVAGAAGEPLELREWQSKLLGHLFARRKDGRRRFRTALVGMPRKNGKSALGSGIALYGLLAEDPGAEVYSCAADRDQARIVFGVAKRMVELDRELSQETKLYRDAIEVPATGSVYRVLSSEAFTKEGLSPNLVVYDELHAAPDDELWNVMNLGSGARVDPLIVAVTTAGVRTDRFGQDTVCYRLYQHGRRVASGEVDDPSFFFAWWEPTKGTECDHADPRVWREANPGYGDLIDPEDFESVVRRTPESEYRTKRTNVWVTSTEAALPYGAWDARAGARGLVEGERGVLFVDGSWNGDSTGIVGCTSDGYLFVVDCWERPLDDPHWRVPVDDVEQTALDRAKGLGWPVAFDPFRWQASMQRLERQGVSVIEFPTNSPARMVPAWKRFYDAVVDGELSHDGDQRLARHVENMRLKIDHLGARPVKESKMSQRHIDLGICAVGAHDIAAIPEPEVEVAPFAMWR
jgi:phage terminase large subunit-like protein